MSVLTIRNVDPAVKAALEEQAKRQGLSQSEVARRAIAKGLGVRVRRRNLVGLPERIFGEEGARQLARVDWTQPAFTDDELDDFMENDGLPQAPDVKAAE